jgi:hypothetical protein
MNADDRVRALLEKRRTVPHSRTTAEIEIKGQRRRAWIDDDGRTKWVDPDTPPGAKTYEFSDLDDLHEALTELERMAVILGACWDGELSSEREKDDDPPPSVEGKDTVFISMGGPHDHSFLAWMSEKAERAESAARKIKEIVDRVGGWG